MSDASPSRGVTASQRERLGHAFAAARADLGDARARTNLALLLMLAGRLEAARRQALAARNIDGLRGEQLRFLGRLLFKLGLFDEAYVTLIAGLREDPRDASSLKVLSALLQSRNNEDGAKRALSAAARVEPITPPRQFDRRKPTLLRFRSFDNARYGAALESATGTYVCRLRGGHFSIKNFVDKSKVNLYLASIMGNNLDQVTKVPDFDLAINTVSCADLHGATLRKLDRFLADSDPKRILNLPSQVLKTSREENARRLGKLDGLVFPRTELYANDLPPEKGVDALLGQGFSFPMILRLPGTQTGESVEKIDNRAGAEAYLRGSGQGQPVYVIDYVDCQGEEGYFHKSRCFFIDQVFYPVAGLSSDSWQIHSGDRYQVMDKQQSLQEREQRYLADPRGFLGEAAIDRLHAIRDCLKLDFFGIDFTLDRQGRLVIFEANAAMRHNYDHATAFPYTRPYLDRASNAFKAMIQRRCARH